MATNTLLTEKERRLALANRIKGLDDVSLPKMKYWNYAACEHHLSVGPQVDCVYRACGGDLFSHQRVGTAWLYAIQKALLADDPGVGKTNQILALTAILKELGQLTRRGLFITPAVGQWGDETTRWIPGVKALKVTSKTPRAKRARQYATDWDVVILTPQLLINDRDLLENLHPFDLVVNDDVDALLNHDNRTHRAIREIAKDATRSFTVNATSLQIKLEQLHGAYVPAGGFDMFGSLANFQRNHVDTQYVTEYDAAGKKKSSRKAVGYKNITELKEKISSVYLRRKATELLDIRMPMIMPPQIEWLEMSQPQRLRYQELQEGVMRLIRDEGEQVKNVTALAKFTYGQQICAGLQALGEPDIPGSSPKLDKLFQRLDDVWADRKTVVFVQNVDMVRAAVQRTQERDYTCALIWGVKQNPAQREEQKAKFWEDPNCRFLIGTKAVIRSHNLQCANTVVGLDTSLNPAVLHQFVGRAARAGSAFERVWPYQFMMLESQESNYWEVLRQRQAVSDVVFDNSSELFEALPPLQLLQLMRP